MPEALGGLQIAPSGLCDKAPVHRRLLNLTKELVITHTAPLTYVQQVSVVDIDYSCQEEHYPRPGTNEG